MEIRSVSKRSDSADFIDDQVAVVVVEEEEALSLCDLPVDSNKDDHKSIEAEIQEKEEDFDFEVAGGSLSSLSEMCSADDIFFKGQILPFRTSQNPNPKIGCLSRSGSIEAFSSRSSSSRSQFSSSSSSGGSSSSSRISRPSIQNQIFFAHSSSSSPKPQIRIPNSSNRNRKASTTWEFFRLSLVHTPEIELQDLKARNSVSRNSSSSSSNNSSNNTNRSSKKQGKERKQSMLLSGCNCRVNSVKEVPYIRIKNEETNQNQNQKKKKEKGKEGMSNHRTFEWIKELSNSNFGDDHERLN